MKRIVWLASYPKSGNTWFRMLLANLRSDKPVDINMPGLRGGIASARAQFDQALLFPSGLLTHEECDRLRPLVYREMAREQDGETPPDELADGEVRFIKTHDAWTHVEQGEPLLGGRDVACGVILIARDPRAVAPSLASHMGLSLDEAISFLGSRESSFCGRTDRQYRQLRQQLPGWSRYHQGWLDQDVLPVHVLRYEELHGDTANVLRRALIFAGIEADDGQIEQAVRFSSFAELKRQEQDYGFREAPPGRREQFFRRGLVGGWREELDSGQIGRIEAVHGAMMTRLGYPFRPAAAP